jgi:DNA topoisomerase-6 subunit B
MTVPKTTLFESDDETEVEAKKPARRKATKSRGASADPASKARDISVAEFFEKNRHMLGFDSPAKALLMAVKEAVDNSLDACEEAGILPEILVEISQVTEKTYRMAVEDNGPGIGDTQIGKIFGQLLYGSKFHKLSQSRGQQGIGISAAGMYGKLTTGKPVVIRSKVKRRKAVEAVLSIDTSKNKAEIHSREEIDWGTKTCGTRIEIEMEATYKKGLRSVDMYLKQTAIANPHLTLTWVDPAGERVVYEANTKEKPKQTVEIKPHPHGVELGRLITMLKETSSRSISGFLQEEFCRVGPTVAKKIVDAAGKGLTIKKEIEADFYTTSTRPAAVYRGNPFQVEVGIAFGKPGQGYEMEDTGRIKKKSRSEQVVADLVADADEPARILRFANRVPLLYQQSACAIAKAVVGTNWRSYGISQPKGSLPIAPMAIIVHIASVWVPFTSESKEAIASYPEILTEIKRALQDCGRKLGIHIRKGKRLQREYQKREYIETYIPHIGIALQEILGLSNTEKDETVEILEGTLHRSRKF